MSYCQSLVYKIFYLMGATLLQATVKFWQVMETINSKLGQNLAHFRKLAGLTQTELGNEINVSQSLLAHYEAGRRNLSVNLIVPITNILNISVEQLLSIPQKTVKHNIQTTPLQKRFDKLKSLPRSQQKMLLSMLDGLIVNLPQAK